MHELNHLVGKEYREIKAKEFEDFICNILSKTGFVKRQVLVKNRGDGRRGKIDLVYYPYSARCSSVGIEIDRKTPRIKSEFKLREFAAEESYLITRSPFAIKKI